MRTGIGLLWSYWQSSRGMGVVSPMAWCVPNWN